MCIYVLISPFLLIVYVGPRGSVTSIKSVCSLIVTYTEYKLRLCHVVKRLDEKWTE